MSPKLEENLEDKLSPGAGAREAAFGKLVEGSPRSILRFWDRALAWRAFCDLLGTGVEAELLLAAMAAMAAAPEFRSRKHPPQLHDWLAKDQWRGWLPEAQPPLAGLEVAATEARSVGRCGDDGAMAAWIGVMADMQVKLGAATFGTWLGRASLGQVGDALYLVAATGVAVDWLRANRWAEIEAAWRARDARPLGLIVKTQFEALVRGAEGNAPMARGEG